MRARGASGSSPISSPRAHSTSGSSRECRLPSRPASASKTRGRRSLENDAVSVRVPAQAREGAPPSGPIAALRLGDRWAAGSGWRTSLAPRRFAVRTTARGPLFARARLRYEFEGSGGEDGATPAFAEVSVTVAAGWRHAEVDEA